MAQKQIIPCTENTTFFGIIIYADANRPDTPYGLEWVRSKVIGFQMSDESPRVRPVTFNKQISSEMKLHLIKDSTGFYPSDELHEIVGQDTLISRDLSEQEMKELVESKFDKKFGGTRFNLEIIPESYRSLCKKKGPQGPQT